MSHFNEYGVDIEEEVIEEGEVRDKDVEGEEEMDSPQVQGVLPVMNLKVFFKLAFVCVARC